MPRNVGTVLANNFSRGLITEATGLNFPDNAVTESDNVVFTRIGSVQRRKGYDIESEGEALVYDETDGIIQEFVWQSVATTGGFTFLVIQMGSQIVFYELTMNENLSAGVLPDTLDLNEYRAPGAGDVSTTPCTFTSGAGYLFVTHPACDPIVLRYNADEEHFEAARVTIYIRDFQGVQDNLGITQEPSELSTEHYYNLKNQGWYKPVWVGDASAGGGPTDQEPVQTPPLEFN